jgi:dUTP pyrophosphatase
MNKTRGFEFLSIEQREKDFEDIQNGMYEKIVITMPRRGTARSAGYDIFAPFDFELKPMEEIKIPTGIKAYMLEDEVLKFHPRSGLGFKYYLRLANQTGVVDSDFYNNPSNEGHIYVKLRNEGDKIVSIKQGEAFCQAIFEKYLLIDGDDFTGNERVGGFGSTGR